MIIAVNRTGIAEVMGSNPVEALIFFFRLLLSNCLNRKIYCDGAMCDGDTGEQFVQLLVITDSQLKVTGDDSCLLVVTSSVARQLEDLSPKILDSVSMPIVQKIAYLSFLLPGLPPHACSRTEHCLMR